MNKNKELSLQESDKSQLTTFVWDSVVIISVVIVATVVSWRLFDDRMKLKKNPVNYLFRALTVNKICIL